MARLDPHSHYDDTQPRTKRWSLGLRIDFAAQRLAGTVVLELEHPGSGPFDLDSKGIGIQKIQAQDGSDVPFELGEETEILGQRLRLQLPPHCREVRIEYTTSATAAALQWLAPAQTDGKRQPFLFSQCQAIHARSVVPCQDTPLVRVSYRAEVIVPEDLVAVMAAGPAGMRPGPMAGLRTYLFEMPQPIPPYLLAFAVGDLASRDLSPRSRVWAEPGVVDAAAWEFGEIESMLTKAESLFGPYDWERYDMLVLPPSFPYGGMENPRLTFLTPTLLAGDRSLVDVVAHELAHSWTGNLVTNATAEHFWLNEGATVWAERRIREALHGADEAILGWAMGQNSLEESLQRFGATSPFTRLRTQLEGVDPDEVFSTIPYEKGSRFLALIEATVGRQRFDRFMRDYMARYRFTSITTEEFTAFLEEKLPGTAAKVDAQSWLYEPGMPANAPVFRSPMLDNLVQLANGWTQGMRPTPEQIASWNPSQMVVYLQNLPRQLDAAACDWLDTALGLTRRGNYEILVEWLTIAGASDYPAVFDRTREVLTRVGRMKYLRPLYTALGKHPRTRALARDIFAVASPTYHGLSRRVVQGILDKYPA